MYVCVCVHVCLLCVYACSVGMCDRGVIYVTRMLVVHVFLGMRNQDTTAHLLYTLVTDYSTCRLLRIAIVVKVNNQ